VITVYHLYLFAVRNVKAKTCAVMCHAHLSGIMCVEGVEKSLKVLRHRIDKLTKGLKIVHVAFFIEFFNCIKRDIYYFYLIFYRVMAC
jgi:hypothetical protein